MDNSILANWWKLILQKDIKMLDDSSLPLIGLDKYLAYFNLPPLPLLEFKMGFGSGTHFGEPSFENLTDKNLVQIRRCIYDERELDTVALWAEKLMRFCEIRYSVLEKRAKKKWGNQETARLNMLQLSVFLLDYGIQSRDFRYINTVLKLGDLKWLLDRKTLAKGLGKKGAEALPALFQFRIVLMTEYALDQIRKGEAL